VFDPNLTEVGGPWSDITFTIHSKFGKTNVVGDLVLLYHELKDKYKIKVSNGTSF